MANYLDLIKLVFEVIHVNKIDYEATIQLNIFIEVGIKPIVQ